MGSLVWGSWAASLLRHLWQSTVFTAGVWLLTLALRRNAARLRYRLWMTASLNFLLPFSLLIAAGARLSSPGHFVRAQPKIVTVVEGVAQPLLEAWPAMRPRLFPWLELVLAERQHMLPPTGCRYCC